MTGTPRAWCLASSLGRNHINSGDNRVLVQTTGRVPKMKKRIITILIDNEFGSLARVVDLFSGRGYNIDSLNVAPVSEDSKISRIAITTKCDQKTISLICKLLNRLIPVHRAIELTSEDFVERELALVKLVGDQNQVQRAIKISAKHQAKIINETENSVIFEIINEARLIDEYLVNIRKEVKPYSVSRTGVLASFCGVFNN